MKRIVDGVTYNTDTSIGVGKSEWDEDDDTQVSETLFQTRGGAFFLLMSTTKRTWDQDEREYSYDEKHILRPLSREKAQGWMMSGQTEVIDSSVFGEPPEAVAEEKPGATIYLRVPVSLKERAELLAKQDQLSLNAWAMRCVESCVNTTPIKRIKLSPET